eukprot:5005308-Pleurochrysis_carterae.AAC.1
MLDPKNAERSERTWVYGSRDVLSSCSYLPFTFTSAGEVCQKLSALTAFSCLLKILESPIIVYTTGQSYLEAILIHSLQSVSAVTISTTRQAVALHLRSIA